MPKPKKIVVVTKPEPWHDGTKTPTPALKEIWNAADEMREYDDKQLLFRPPMFRPIEPPAEMFDTDAKKYLFQCAVHEVCHGLACMVVCKEVQALTVTSINGYVRGSAFSTDAHGEDAAIIDIAGLAGEQLVVGSGDCHAGAQCDIKQARQHLRDDRISEAQIDRVLADIHAELQNVFEADFLPGIVFAATKLAQVGVLDWSGFIELLAQGQRQAFQAGSLRKAANLLGAHDTLHKAIARRRTPSEFDMLAREISRSK